MSLNVPYTVCLFKNANSIMGKIIVRVCYYADINVYVSIRVSVRARVSI